MSGESSRKKKSSRKTKTRKHGSASSIKTKSVDYSKLPKQKERFTKLRTQRIVAKHDRENQNIADMHSQYEREQGFKWGGSGTRSSQYSQGKMSADRFGPAGFRNLNPRPTTPNEMLEFQQESPEEYYTLRPIISYSKKPARRIYHKHNVIAPHQISIDPKTHHAKKTTYVEHYDGSPENLTPFVPFPVATDYERQLVEDRNAARIRRNAEIRKTKANLAMRNEERKQLRTGFAEIIAKEKHRKAQLRKTRLREEQMVTDFFENHKKGIKKPMESRQYETYENDSDVARRAKLEAQRENVRREQHRLETLAQELKVDLDKLSSEERKQATKKRSRSHSSSESRKELRNKATGRGGKSHSTGSRTMEERVKLKTKRRMEKHKVFTTTKKRRVHSRSLSSGLAAPRSIPADYAL